MPGNPLNEFMVNADAEQSVLGSVLIDPRCAAKLPGISEDDFGENGHRTLFQAMRAVNGRGGPIDLVTVTDELSRMDALERAGGFAYLADLSRYMPTTANFDAYLRLLKEASNRRRIGALCFQMAQTAMDTGLAYADFEKELAKWLSGIKPSAISREDESITAAVIEVLRVLSERASGTGLGERTGLAAYDSITGGMFGGEVTVLAGRPGMGKTALALHIAQTFAKAGKPVQFFTREMSRVALVMRVISAESGVSQGRMRMGDFSDDDWDAIADGANRLYGLPFWINITAASPAKMRAECAGRKDKDGLGLVVIDYLQLLESDDRYANTNERMARISWAIRAMAGEFNVPVLLLSQLNRKIEERRDRPNMSDLRDSGAIEQDADNVVILWQPADESTHFLRTCLEEDGKRLVRAEILKQRNGELGYADMIFDPGKMIFSDLPGLDETQRGEDAK